MFRKKGLIALLLGAAFPGAVGLPQVRPAVDDFYYSRDRRVAVRVALDQIAVVTREGVGREGVEEIARERDWRVGGELSPRIFLLQVGGTEDRRRLDRLAREIREEKRDTIAQAGLVISETDGDGPPMVLTDELTVKFRPDVTEERIQELNRRNSVEVAKQSRVRTSVYVLRVTRDSDGDALTVSKRYFESRLAEYAQPNFTRVLELRQWCPDTYFSDQWHHANTSQGGGTSDADIDTPLAWRLTEGSKDVVLAVIDSGFDMVQPDLVPNFWENAGEMAGNSTDDDNNSYVDDVHGWDFAGCGSSSAGCGDGDPTGPDTPEGRHGTAVAGAAAARGGNGLGVSGSCPQCRLMLLRVDPEASPDDEPGSALEYALEMKADVVSISWGYGGNQYPDDVADAIALLATSGRGGKGTPVFIAMSTTKGFKDAEEGYEEDCVGTTPDISSLPEVVAVSASNNRDRRTPSGYGDCMDVLAPADGGTLDAATTDVHGPAGYNDENVPNTCPTPLTLACKDSTRCFGGTSFSAPLTAGVAGLVLAAQPDLTRVEVQRLLQDTADRIDPSKAHYDPITGFSQPLLAPSSTQPLGSTHGYGRINAFEAVRVAAPVTDGGRGGVDILLRDNALDWGNTEQPSNTLFESPRGSIPHWHSMDIKVDAPPYGPIPTADTFDSLADESPLEGQANRAYVRVRNRGPDTADAVKVKLQWAYAGTGLPALPSDFWCRFPDDSSDLSQWHPLPCGGSSSTTCDIDDLSYSGSSVAGSAEDASRIVRFDFVGPSVPAGGPNHFCLMAIVDSPQDPVSSATKASLLVDQITPTDNNVTHRNYKVEPSSTGTDVVESLFVRNPTAQSLEVRLRYEAPQDWTIAIDRLAFDEPFRLEPGDEVRLELRIRRPTSDAAGEVTVFQEMEIREERFTGGMTYSFPRRNR